MITDEGGEKGGKKDKEKNGEARLLHASCFNNRLRGASAEGLGFVEASESDVYQGRDLAGRTIMRRSEMSLGARTPSLMGAARERSVFSHWSYTANIFIL